MTPTTPLVYQRQYQPFIMILILLGAVIGGGFIGSMAGAPIQSAFGINMNSLLTGEFEGMNQEQRHGMRLVQFVSQLFTFVLAAGFVAFLAYAKKWQQYLRLTPPLPARHLWLTIFMILAAMPLVQGSYLVNKMIDLPAWALQIEEMAEGLIKSFMVMDSPMELVLNLLILAVMPALGEEMVFRGVLQQELQRRYHGRDYSQVPHVAIWVTAFIFSLFHFQFAGFLPRMLLGALLGYMFYWSASLWVPILGHAIFNGSQVIMAYVMGIEKMETMEAEAELGVGIWIAAAFSAIIVALLGQYLYKNRVIPENEAPPGGPDFISENHL